MKNWVDYYFEVTDEDSPWYGEEFLVEVEDTPNSLDEAWAIARENFPNEKMKCWDKYSVEEAEIMGLDTY